MLIRYHNPLTKRFGYDFYADIAEKIVEARKKCGMNQSDLAGKTGISISKIRRYETVQIRCTLDDLNKIADALSVTVDFLICAEFDDEDCGDCLYTVGNERFESDDMEKGMLLYFKANSAQRAFLEAYAWSLRVGCVWFEPRDRAFVTLRGVPVKKRDYANLKKRTSDEDEIFPDEKIENQPC